MMIPISSHTFATVVVVVGFEDSDCLLALSFFLQPFGSPFSENLCSGRFDVVVAPPITMALGGCEDGFVSEIRHIYRDG